MSNSNENQKNYKEILSAYRNGDEERYADDFDEAFMALETDEELAAWFNEDQAFDAEFGARIKEFEVPEQKKVESPKALIVHFPLFKLAVAALLILGLGFFGVIRFDQIQQVKTAARVDNFRHSMAVFAESKFELDLMNNDLSKLRSIVTAKGGSAGDALDQIFKHSMPKGCKVVNWGETTVSLYCFANDQGQVVHSFVVPLKQLNGPRAADYIRTIVSHENRENGGFVSGDMAYLLIASMPGVDIRPFLPATQMNYSQRPTVACMLIPRL